MILGHFVDNHFFLISLNPLNIILPYYLCCMNKNIAYRIAGHNILVNTTDEVSTNIVLPNFAPFLLKEEHPADILFCFSGNHAIDKPNVPPIDKIEWYGINSTVYATSTGTVISVEINGKKQWLSASPDWKTIVVDFSTSDATKRFFLNQFIMLAYGISGAVRKTLKIHASVIEKNGKALLFLGESGTGKSTHSRLWLEHVPGCSLLNDDEPVVRVLEDGSVRVYGTPWSGKTPCYRNISAKVVAFVHLHQSPVNKLSMLNSIEALSSLYTSTSMLRSDAENKTLVFDTIADILQQVPVYRLDCLPDKEAVSLTESLLRNSQ